ncbi:ift122, partial [Symbiodinium sp. CCMP2456]
QVGVPAMCQRLLLHNIPRMPVLEQMLCYFADTALKGADCLDKRDITCLKGLSRPPADTVEVLNVALVLLATSSNKRIADRIECNKKGLPRDLGWRSCVRMMNDATEMMIAMKEYNPDIWNGHVRAANIAAAEDMIAKLGPRFTPQYVNRLSRAASHIAAWALGVVRCYQLYISSQAGDETMSLELENSAPLSLYLKCMGPDCKQIAVSLLVNIEPAISALEGGPRGVDIQLEAVEALKVLGPRSDAERSLKALAPRLVSPSADLRKAVLSAIQQGFSSDDEVVSTLCSELEKDNGLKKMAVIQALSNQAPEGDERTLQALQRYLERSDSLLGEEGPETLLAAEKLVRKLGGEEQTRKAEKLLMDALVRHLARTGDTVFWPPLRTLCKERHATVQLSNFRIIAKGFRRQNFRMRHVYSQVFERLICFGEGRDAAAVLIEVIQQDLFDWSRIIAAELLPRAVGAKEDSEAILAILLLLNDSSVLCKLASLHALLAFTPRPFPDEVTEAAEKHLRHEDEGIRQAALLVLEHIHGIEFFPEKLGRCLRDPVSNVVQSAVQLLAVLLERGKGTEQALAALPPLLTHGDWAVRQAAVSALGQAGNRVLVYDATDGDLVHSLKGHKDSVFCVAYSRHGKKFASGGADKQVIIWTHKAEGILKYNHNESIQCLAYNPVTQQLASGTASDLGLWSPEQKSVSKRKVNSKILSMSWTNDGLHIALGLFSGHVSIRDKFGEEKADIVRQAPIWTLAWNPVQTKQDPTDVLVVGCWDQTLSFYKVSGQEYGREHRLEFDPCSIDFFSSGDYFVLGGSGKKVQLWSREGIYLGDLGE